MVGLTAPVVAALIAVPILVKALGTDRFALLGIAQILVGYLGLFDLGLGRALTRAVASTASGERPSEVAVVATSGLIVAVALGLVGTTAAYLATPLLVSVLLPIPTELRSEASSAFAIVALSVVFVVGTSGLRGVLEGLQRFRSSNTLRAPLGVALYLAPLFVLPYTHNLVAVTSALVAVRVTFFCLYLRSAIAALPAGSQGRWSTQTARRLAGYGSWITVSNIVGPIMVYGDRFVLAAVVPITTVAYYIAPYEMATKLSLIPIAIASALMPNVAGALTPTDASRSYVTAVKATFILILIPTLVLIIAAPDLLNVWLGGDFALQGTVVLQILAVGVFANSLAQLPLTLVQGVGRPSVTGRLHLVELPIYLAVIWLMASPLGIWGVALAWTLRTTLDAAVLFAVARPHHTIVRPGRAIFVLAITAMLMVGGFLLHDLPWRVAYLVVSILIAALMSWHVVLEPMERRSVLGALHRGRQIYRRRGD